MAAACTAIFSLSSCRQPVEDLEFYSSEGEKVLLYRQAGLFGLGSDPVTVLETPQTVRPGDLITLTIPPGTPDFILSLYPPENSRGGVQTDYALSRLTVRPPQVGPKDTRRLELTIDPMEDIWPETAVSRPEPNRDVVRTGDTKTGDSDPSAASAHPAQVQIAGFRASFLQGDSNAPVPLVRLQLSEQRQPGFGFHHDRIGLPPQGGYREELTLVDPGENVVESLQELILPPSMTADPGPNRLSYLSLRYEYDVPPGRLNLTGEASDDGSSRSNPSSGEQAVSPRIRVEVLPALTSSANPGIVEMVIHPGEHETVLYPAELGFIPHSLRIISREPGFLLTGVSTGTYTSVLEPRTAQLFSMDSPPIPEPLPIDLGTLLRYPQAAWRHRDFELYSWDLYAPILIFDFRTREIQSAFFKRLAFFVEKKNFRGTLLSNTQLQGRHGWNAHNYRAEGLANFFSAAEAQGFALNPEEEYLKKLLLAHGIILQAPQAGYRPGEGGIISITRDPRETPASRLLFMTHEALHGVYYQTPELVQQSRIEWNNLSDASREYITRYFSYMQYDPGDTYLMENEFQAYLLQQPLGQLTWTIAGRYRDRLMAAYPAEADWFRRQASTTAAESLEAAARLQNLLFQQTGLLPGDFRAHRRVFVE